MFYSSMPEVPNLSLTMLPFSNSIDEHVHLKVLMTKRLSKISKSTEVLIELLYVRIFGNKCKYIFLLNVPPGVRTPGWEPLLYAQWRTQKISEGGQSFVTIVWRHKSTLGEVPKARSF